MSGMDFGASGSFFVSGNGCFKGVLSLEASAVGFTEISLSFDGSS